MNLKLSMGIVVMCFILSGCVSTSTIDVAAEMSISSNMSITDIEVNNASGEQFDGVDVVSKMSSAVREAIEEANINKEGGEPHKMVITIIQYKKGSAAARWLVPGMGKTLLSVEADLLTESGQRVASSQATKSVGAGGLYTIGAWERIFGQVADDLIDDIRAEMK